MGRFMLTVTSGIAELERDLIRKRCQAGIERAKEKGVKFGRLRINELLEQVKLKPAAQRALLAALNRAVKREAESGPPGAASFWQAISEYIASRQATLGDD